LPEGVRVAVIDSGVNPRHPHIGRIAGGVSIAASGETGPDYIDSLGHGTAIMAAIQEKAPGADYFAVRVFHSALRTSGVNLVRALDWCIGNRMQVVNLSLGSTNAAHAQEFLSAVNRANEAGMLVVAAFETEGNLCYPGCLPGVAGVRLDWDCPRDRYRHVNGLFYASGYPRSAPGIPVSRNLSGISFAVANVTGLLVKDGLGSFAALNNAAFPISSGLA
jgi:hypothetical protein